MFNSPWIAAQLGRDVPWAKISDEFVHGRHSSLNKHFNNLINDFDLLSALLLSQVQLFPDCAMYFGKSSWQSSLMGDIAC